MKQVLIVSGHCDLKQSLANQTILTRLAETLPNAAFDYLSERYPDYKIDSRKEQQQLLAADVIILQFPIFWYSIPSLLAKWLEDTLQHGFSHGTDGHQLKGKKLLVSFTTGSAEEVYHQNASKHHEIEELLYGLMLTAELCGMEYVGYVYTGGVSYRHREDPILHAEIIEKAKAHAMRVTTIVNSLTE